MKRRRQTEYERGYEAGQRAMRNRVWLQFRNYDFKDWKRNEWNTWVRIRPARLRAAAERAAEGPR